MAPSANHDYWFYRRGYQKDHTLTVVLMKLPTLEWPAADTLLPWSGALDTFCALSKESSTSSDVQQVLQTAATTKCLKELGPENIMMQNMQNL